MRNTIIPLLDTRGQEMTIPSVISPSKSTCFRLSLPLEMVLSKLKTLLRDATEQSLDDSRSRFGTLLDGFSPQ